ncbi:MAG TPA: glycosyltransferase, partial [Pirellulales bacterium]|nr:glycosyltransferase [Pirellulales bacterium]
MIALLEAPATPVGTIGKVIRAAKVNYQDAATDPSSIEALRLCAWQIGERRAADALAPTDNHVGLAQVSPYQAFTHWRIRQEWVNEAMHQRGQAWHNCRLILRLYDVSFIEFNGLNAHQIHDYTLPCICGHMFVKLAKPGTWQLGEVGFLLRGGEFVPAARSRVAAFSPDAPVANGSQAALLVTGRGPIEQVANIWDQEKILRERRQPRPRRSLRLAAFAFEARPAGSESGLGQFVSELAAGQAALGHEVHVFVPATAQLPEYRQVAGVHYQPLDVSLVGSPLEVAASFGAAAGKRLGELPAFDAIHLHEWMTGRVTAPDSCPRVLSLSSIEASRLQDGPITDLSQAIEKTERTMARQMPLVLTPPWLRAQAVEKLGLDGSRVRAFPMEGRMPNEWELPLDPGQVKMGIGIGPLDRLILFIGPLEHAAGVDVLLEAMPTVLHRAGNVRLAYVGDGFMHGQLQERAHHLGVAHAVRLLGHVEGPALCRLLRSAEALVLPSRYRVPFDDAVVDLARQAGRPVITTHAGPAHLVRHEENGIVTYDNPGSMVWALDRVLGDPAHAERMGSNGRRSDTTTVVWGDVARHYLEL